MIKIFKILNDFKSSLYNSFWMITEQIFRMFSGLLIAILIARTSSTEFYGDFSYILALISIFIPIVQFAMPVVLIKQLSIAIDDDDFNRKMNSSFFILVVTSLIGFITLNTFNYINNNGVLFYSVFVYSFILLFKPFDIVDYYHQSKQTAKISSKYKLLSIFIALLIKAYFIYKSYGLIYIVFSFFIEYLILMFLYIYYITTDNRINISLNFLDLYFIKVISKSCFPLLISIVSAILFIKVDQIMLKSIVGSHELGVYSASVRLYEGYNAILYTISISFFPLLLKVYNEKGEEFFDKMLAKFFSIIIWLNILVFLFVLIFSKNIILFFYGESYLGGENALIVIFISSVFASFGSMTSRYFVVKGKEKKILKRSIFSLIANILLNLCLIEYYGIVGSSLATLISLALGYYVFDYFDKDSKGLIKIKNRSLLLKWK